MTKVLVTGASGQLGRGVIAELLKQAKLEPSQIVAGSRDPASLADAQAKGIETRRVDFDDANGMEEAFAGIDRLLIISSGELAVPSKRFSSIRRLSPRLPRQASATSSIPRCQIRTTRSSALPLTI